MRMLAAMMTALLLLSACGGGSDPAEADVTFAQQMIPHHEQAVEMTSMVPGSEASPEVRDLAGRIASAQEPEITTMRGWLEDWDAEEDDMGSMGSMEGMMSGADMAVLDDATGADFDRRWLQMMVEHHTGAIAMAETVLDDGEDPDVRTLAEDIIDAQRTEIAEMEGLLDE